VNQLSLTRTPLRLISVIAFALALTPALAPAADPKAAPAPPELPTFKADTSMIEADDHLQWSIPFTIENRFTVGLYLDSLFCEVQDLDPGETRAERVTRIDVSHVVAGNSASAGETYPFNYVAPAIAEHARLTFRLVVSRADKSRTTLTTVVEAMPGPVSRDHPSEFLTVNGRRVEVVFFTADHDSAPGLLVVHGRGGNARTLLRMGTRLVQLGYAAMMVSMPGYGQSEGPPDAAGPLTVQAVGAALDRLEATAGVDAKRVGAWGISNGAAAVTLLSQGRSDLKATVAQSGIYDLWAVYRAMTVPALREAIVHGAGSDSAGWKKRSAALNPGKPTAILILHGEKDVNVPAQQAHGFAESLKARGVDVESRFFPNSGHELPPGEVMRTAIEFLDRRLGN
jgi:dipeptidyl aminopeptidase/acylaminoacyl peptidase